LVAVPAIHLHAALVHQNRADASGNALYLGPDPYFDDLFCMAAERAYLSCERTVPTEALVAIAPMQSLRSQRWMVHGVVEAPHGAHFTSCGPDYGRDEEFQAEYVRAAGDPQSWVEFERRYLACDEAGYQAAVAARRAQAMEVA